MLFNRCQFIITINVCNGTTLLTCYSYSCVLLCVSELFILVFVVVCDTLHLPSPSSSNSFAKRLLKIGKRWKKEQEVDKGKNDSRERWEKDYELVPLSIHGLFFEYLELGEAVLHCWMILTMFIPMQRAFAPQ